MMQSEGASVFRLRFGVLCNSRTNLWLVSQYLKVASRDTPIRDLSASGCHHALFLSSKATLGVKTMFGQLLIPPGATFFNGVVAIYDLSHEHRRWQTAPQDRVDKTIWAGSAESRLRPEQAFGLYLRLLLGREAMRERGSKDGRCNRYTQVQCDELPHL